MPNFLYIDTSSEVSVIACTVNGAIASCQTNAQPKEQAAQTNLLIDGALKESGIALNDIDAIALCSGPGSYTGLRIGFSAAKGLCYAADKHLILTDRFRLIERQYSNTTGDFTKAIILKARTGEYFFAVYDAEGGNTIAPCLMSEQELTSQINMLNTIVLSNDKAICTHFTNENSKAVLLENFRPDISTWEKIVLKNYDANEFADIAYSEPLYIKQAFTTVSKKKMF